MKKVLSMLVGVVLLSIFAGTLYYLWSKSEEPPIVYETGYTALIAGATAHLPTKAIEREHPEMPDDVKRQLRALGYAD